MKQRQFIDALECAGWRNTCDAQHSGVKSLWQQLFPLEARLERLEGAVEEIERLAVAELESDSLHDHQRLEEIVELCNKVI